MTAIGVKGVISVDVGVTDLARSKDFYTRVWLLSPVLETNSAVYLRGSAPYHHILALHRRPTAELLRINLMAPDRQSVDTLHARISRQQALAYRSAGRELRARRRIWFCIQGSRGPHRTHPYG